LVSYPIITVSLLLIRRYIPPLPPPVFRMITGCLEVEVVVVVMVVVVVYYAHIG